MKWLIFGLMALLAVVHQDFWWWDRAEPFVLGFIPIGLAYHAGVSLAAACLWALAVKYCWPEEAEVVEEKLEAGPQPGGDA